MVGAWLQAWKGAPVGLQDQTQQQAAGVAALLLSYLPQMPSICAEPGGARRIRRLPLCPLHLPARLSLVQSWGRMPSRRSWRGTPRPCTSTAPTRWGPGGWQARPAGRGCLFIELWGLPHRHHPPTRRCHTLSAAAGGVGRGGGSCAGAGGSVRFGLVRAIAPGKGEDQGWGNQQAGTDRVHGGISSV